MKKKLLAALPAILLGLTLIGCNNETVSSSDSNPSIGDSSESIDSSVTDTEPDEEFTQGTTPLNISQPSVKNPVGQLNQVGLMKKSEGKGALPQQGQANILVVPVNFANSSVRFDTTRVNNLNNFFFGSTNSVSSYFNKVSAGKLNLSGVVGPVDAIDLPYTLNQYYDQVLNRMDPSSVLADIAEYVVDQIFVSDTTRTLDVADFDADDDGRVDMISLVFAEAPYDGTSSGDVNLDAAKAAFLSPGALFNPLAESDSKVKVGGITWSPYSYASGIYSGVYYTQVANMIGIESTNDNVGDGNGNYRAPMGNTEIMDTYVTTDMSSFSKFQMGWYAPKAVYTAADVDEENGLTFTLKPSESSGEFVMLAPEGEDGSDPFGEYLLVDFYTPTGYNNGILSSNYMKNPGIRVLKVDSRLAKEVDGHWTELAGAYDFNDGSAYNYAYSNNYTGDYYSDGITNNFPLVEFLSQEQDNRHMTSYMTLTDDALFKQGEGFGTIGGPNDFYADFEFDGNGLNGPKLGLTFTVDSITDTEATITLRRAA